MGKTTSKTADTGKVTLFRRGQYLEIIPPVGGLIERFLTVQHVGHATTTQGFVLKRQPFPLIWPQVDQFGQKYFETFAGLESEITKHLEASGYQVVMKGDRPQPLPDPDWKKLPSNRTGDRRLLRFVQQHERGIIWYRESRIDIAWLIAQVALTYPKEKIVVIASRQADAAILTKRLRRYISGVSLATPHHHPAIAGRVVVATPSGLQQTGVRVRERTICFCINPTEVFNTMKVWFSSKDWLPVLKSRLYGLLNEDLSLAPQQQDYLRALFGTQRLLIPRHGFGELPVTIKFWQFQGGRKIAPETPIHELKRQCVWRDPLRNRLIAGLAQAIAMEDDKALGKKFTSIAQALYSKLGRRVAVLVENVEHAGHLVQRLPGWPIVADEVSDSSQLSQKVKDALVAGANTVAQRTEDVIVTTAAFGKIGAVDVLIRADAGVSLPPISSDFFVAGDGVPKSMTVIDVDDRHHPHLRRRAKWRKNAYLQRGWEVDGTWRNCDPHDPLDCPTQCFASGSPADSVGFVPSTASR